MEAAAKLEIVSLSNNTVDNQIEEISIDIADLVISDVKDSKFGFSMQLDEWTDITKNFNYLSMFAILLKTRMWKLSC